MGIVLGRSLMDHTASLILFHSQVIPNPHWILAGILGVDNWSVRLGKCIQSQITIPGKTCDKSDGR
jgi:hypothetical protein